MALAAADCWAEEDLSCRTAWAENPEDFDLEDPDPAEREGDRGPFWEDVWAADERRQAINRTLADQVLRWANGRTPDSGLEAARLVLTWGARTSVESLDGHQARFDLAYLAQEAAGRVRWERQVACERCGHGSSEHTGASVPPNAPGDVTARLDKHRVSPY